MKKTVKKTLLGALISVIAFLLILNTVILLLLNVPAIQKWCAGFAIDYVTEKTGTKIEIGHLQLDVFNGIYIKDLYVEDLNKDTLAYIGLLNVDYSLKKIYWKNTLNIKRVALKDFTAKLSAANDSADFNFQFLIDAFASDEPEDTTSGPTKFNLAINQILLKNGSFAYDIYSEPDTSALFNASHIRIDSLYFTSDLNLNLPSTLDADCEELSCKEKSGLRLRYFDAPIHFNLDSLTLSAPSLAIKADETWLSGSDIYFNIDSLSLAATIDSASIVASDFQCFVPMLNRFSDPIALSGKAEGTLPQISVSQLHINYPQTLQLYSPRLSIDDYSQWQKTHIFAQLERVVVEPGAPITLQRLFDVALPAMVDSLLPCSLRVAAEGTLPDFQESLDLTTPIGKISSIGIINFLADLNQLKAETNWDIDVSTLKPIVGSDIAKNLRLQLSNTIDWNLAENPSATLKGEVLTANLFNYSYRPINIDCEYDKSGDVKASIRTDDPNCSFDLESTVQQLMTDSMNADIRLVLNNINPSKLNLAESLPFNTASGIFTVNGVGMDYNQWWGNISLDDIQLDGDTADLHIDYVRFTQTSTGKRKNIDLKSSFLDATAEGEFKYEELYGCAQDVLSKYFPTVFHDTASVVNPTDITFDLHTDEVNSILKYFGVDLSLLGSLKVNGSLSNKKDKHLTLSVHTPQIETSQIAVAPSSVDFKTEAERIFGAITTTIRPNKEQDFSAVIGTHIIALHDSIYNVTEMGTMPDTLFLRGDLWNCISFHPTSNGNFKIRLNIDKSSIFLNEKEIVNNKAVLEYPLGVPTRITIDNFGLSTTEQPLLSVNGVVSESLTDTLNVEFDKLKLQTLLSLLYINDLPLDLQVNGRVRATAILSEDFRFFTRGFHLDSINYDGNEFGDLVASAIWDNKRKGVGAKMQLTKDSLRLMDIKGIVAPSDHYIRMTAVLDSVPLALAVPFTSEYVSDVQGYIGSDIKIEGDLTSPDINGYVYLLDAKAKINYTGVTYSISDSVKMDKNHFYAKRFKVTDNFGNKLFFNGDIYHDHFQTFKYEMILFMRDFALLNNPKDRNKIAYGKFFANAKALKLVGDEKHANLTGEFSNSDNTIVNINLPESATEASTYDNIVYVSSNVDLSQEEDTAQVENEEAFKIYANLDLGLTDKAAFYVNVADGAMVKGNGNLKIVYEDNNISLYNRFTVSDGYVKLKLSGIPTKKFSIQEGSYVDFSGNPMNLKFNATVNYGLTADLATLSSSFSSLSSTRVPVNCVLTASGDLNNMSLGYDVALPKANEEVQQQVASIVNTDNIKIMEFAYLIGLGMFSDPYGEAGGNAMMSFASSSLSSSLNNVLGNVLGDKVTIGTDLNSTKDDLSDMEVGVSVSTKLAHDKLLLSTNLGMQQNSTTNTSGFMGDFDAEYLLGKTGIFRLKAYNHTNNDIFRTSNNTQGIGFSFVRESKQLKNLFNIKGEFKSSKESDPAIRKDEKPEIREEKTVDSNKKSNQKDPSTVPSEEKSNGVKKDDEEAHK